MKLDIENLLIKRLAEGLTPDEELQFQEWLEMDIKNQKRFDDFTMLWISGKALYNPYKINIDEQWKKLLDKQQESHTRVSKNFFRVNSKRTMGLAASIVLFVALGISYFYNLQVISDHSLEQELPEFAAYSEHGAIVLSNGVSLNLNESHGEIVYKGNEGTILFDDKELFQGTDPIAEGSETVIEYNQITVPRGHTYQITLSDGTKVWLNSYSRFIFPRIFKGKQRQVKLEGEGYFEVAHNENQPFIVNTSHIDIRVLGTKFNVYCYADDDLIETTLVEGSVSINSNTKANIKRPLVLAPNQKAGFQKSIGSIRATENIDPEYQIAWKNGYFKYYNEPFTKIIAQLERNYGIKVDFNPDDFKDLKITGKLQRKKTVEDLFEAISILVSIEYNIYKENQITLKKKI